MSQIPKPERYAPMGLLAVMPSAMGLEYVRAATAPSLFSEHGPRAMVRVSGPLAYEPECGLDTYASIRCRVQAALASSASEVVIHISSPGGDVNGLFDTARGIRDDANRAGKRLIAYSDATAASSAYALACACDEIVCSDTATLGSIGVIAVLPDLSAANAAQGVAVNIIASGERKADGNPMAPMSEGARAAIQQSVDAMAGVFFQHVADRRGLSVETVKAFQAGVFVGAAAVAAGLANSVASLDSLLGRPVGAIAANTILPEASQMADKDEDKKEPVDARGALVAASENPDEKDEAKRARAKRALAAYDAEMADEDEDKKDASASAEAKAVTVLSAEVQSLSAKLAARDARDAKLERASFMASHPELSAALVATFADLPLDRVKAIVASLPPSNTLAATAVVVPTAVGSLTGDFSKPTALSAQASALDVAMGLVPMTSGGVAHSGTVLQLGVHAPKVN